MKKCYDDPELHLENRYFTMPDNVIAVPISAGSGDQGDLFNRDVYVEYFTPKGFARYRSGELNNTPPPAQQESDNPQDSTKTQTAPTPIQMPVLTPQEQY